MKHFRTKDILKIVTSRLFIISALILFQLSLFVVMLMALNNYLFYFNTFCLILSLIICLYIVVKDDNPIYKVAWLIPVVLLPIFGVFFYFIFGKRNIDPKSRKTITELTLETHKHSPKNQNIKDEIKEISPTIAKQSEYISSIALAPPWKNTQTKYLSPGEVKFKHLIEHLKKAEKFILLEYFIIEPGVMWDSVLELLKEKVSQRVEVKVIYDDIGTIQLLPPKYDLELAKFGIETVVFNPFHAALNAFMNYRDHRKIAIIDGNVAFTGGINLADEYINEYEKFGHWKDASIMLKGDAVANLTILFLDSWQFCTQKKLDYDKYKPTKSYESDGYVQPFGDSPIDKELVGEMVYMNIINNATKYIYICTPYLILDNEMLTSLKLAAQSGIDVRIITPHIPDKFYVHEVTRSNYPTLISAGVKIYEYTPGFLHSKTLVSDDELAVVGTTNFDFRSFYMHFECGTFLFRTTAVKEVLEDFFETQKLSQ